MSMVIITDNHLSKLFGLLVIKTFNFFKNPIKGYLLVVIDFF